MCTHRNMDYENRLIRGHMQFNEPLVTQFTNKVLTQNKELSIDKIALKTVGDFGKVCSIISETNIKKSEQALSIIKKKHNCKKYLCQTLSDLTLLANKLGITLEELMEENLTQD